MTAAGFLPAPHPGDLLSARLDGELPADDAAAVDDHLASCETCAVEMAALDHTRALVRALPRLDAPRGLGTTLVARRRRATRRGTTLALVAAVLALVVGIVTSDPTSPAPAPRTATLTGEGPRRDLPPAVAAAPPEEAEATGGESLSDRLDRAVRSLLDTLTG